MKNILITNNALVNEKYKDQITTIYLEDLDYLKVLELVRDKIHIGHELLTHPLSGSIKPNETPFKSVLISDKVSEINFDSLSIIEESILTAKKFLDQKKIRNWQGKDVLHNKEVLLRCRRRRIHPLGRYPQV